MDHTFNTCSNCRWWVTLQPGGVEGRAGKCRRNPPQIMPSHGAAITDWPQTEESDWCGEFLETVN